MMNQVFALSTDYALQHGDFAPRGYFLFNLQSGKIFKLNKVSYAMLEAFDGSRSVDGVVQAMLARYNVDVGRVSSDLSALVDQWVKQGILVERR